MQPDSRRSASIGRLSARISRPRESCDRATTGRLELAGEDLEAAAELGHLDLAVLGARPAGHQLEVVDDDHPEVADLALEPAGLGPDLHDREVGVVVDPDRRLGEPAHGVGDLLPVVGLELAVAHPRGVDPRLGAEEPLRELEVAHLEREEEDRRRVGASRAAWATMPSANEVLPMAGRAPTTTSELGWRPDRSSSRSR